jgi:hypothetical protein
MAKSTSITKHFEKIADRLDQVITILDDLLEDPIFLDNIHGEQELSLDLALEVLDGIAAKFEPQEPEKEWQPLAADDSFDAE